MEIFFELAPDVMTGKAGFIMGTVWELWVARCKQLTMKYFPEIPESDIVVKAITCVCQVGGEAIEVKALCTIGEDEYGTGTPFEPTKAQLANFRDAIGNAVKDIAQMNIGYRL
ncbi:MAG: hypothetical protein HZA95_04160 [Candidatus Vogelbacteria bacterium]|nr:hypothetical protein [Candidatus Vogelbacteria bacterium]